MPQLDNLSFLSQIFFIYVFVYFFLFLFMLYVLPTMYASFFVRNVNIKSFK